MGFRLDGPEIEYVDSADIISDGAVLALFKFHRMDIQSPHGRPPNNRG